MTICRLKRKTLFPRQTDMIFLTLNIISRIRGAGLLIPTKTTTRVLQAAAGTEAQALMRLKGRAGSDYMSLGGCFCLKPLTISVFIIYEMILFGVQMGKTED